MEANLSVRIYTVSEDIIDLSDGTSYYIGEIKLANSGELSVVLDANPIENRITCYYSDSQGWTAINYNHRSIGLSDEIKYHLSSILMAVRAASK